MDLAIYINELLGLKGEVNVPGIGFFEQKRVGGYYNEREKKFYPPHHEIIFDPQSKEDDSLATYISTKKNISPASAKYFIDKYSTGLRAQASEQKVDITGLGHLYYEYSVLSFKADKSHDASDPSFYGLAPVKAEKSAGAPKVVQKPPAKPGPVVETHIKETPAEAIKIETIDEEQPAFTDTRDYIPQEVYEEERGAGTGRVWVTVLLVVIVGLLGFGVLYQYKPAWFGRKEAADTTIIIRSAPPAIKKPDSTKASAVKDTAAPGANPPGTIKPAIDTFAVKHYDVAGGAFASLSNFNKALKDYTSLGLHPRAAKQTGNQHTIIFSTFFNYADAKRAKDSILNIKGINKTRIFIQTYIPKK
jgi:hypothetical protein